MSERLDKVKLVKGPKGYLERKDSLDNIGESTFAMIREAVQEGRKQLAKDLTDYLFIPEVKFVHDAGCDWLWGWPSFVADNYGEDAAGELLRESIMHGWALDWFSMPPAVEKAKLSAEERALTSGAYPAGYPFRTWRGHRMGTMDGALGFVVEEYENRFEVVWDPCSSGGRMRRGDEIECTPSRLGSPYNLRTTQAPHPWSWGKKGVGLYCCHCCIVHEQMEVEKRGYFNLWVAKPPDTKDETCRWIYYKNQDAIPEEYYTSLGKTKPPVTSVVEKPKQPNKVIRKINALDLFGGYHYTNLKEAVDAGDKAKALEILDDIAIQTKRLHNTYVRWNWAWMDLIADKYGYNELYHALRDVDYSFKPAPPPATHKATKAPVPSAGHMPVIPSAEERARQAALWGRSDRSGPNAEGSVRIVDEGDKFVMVMDPCGSGQGMRLGDPLMKTPSVLGPPWNLGVTTMAHPVGWGKLGISHYCTRCCVQEEMGSVVRTGYLATIVERDEDYSKPCRWLFYKDLDDIPEKYYTGIGARKPAATVPTAAPVYL